MNYVESFNLFGTEAKQIPCIKGTGAPTDKTEGAAGCFYMDTDTGEIYKCVSVSEGAYAWEPVGGSAAGKATESGGAIFGHESNEATGEASIAAGDVAMRVDGKYAENADGKVYVVSVDCDLAKREDVVSIGYEVIGLEELNNGTDTYVLTSTGGYCLREDARFNEAVGSGSTANGLGAVAFSRASKSLGYRTQTGYPPSKEWLKERPELEALGRYFSRLDIESGMGSTEIEVNVTGSKSIEFYYDLENYIVFSGSVSPSATASFYKANGEYISSRAIVMTEGKNQHITITPPTDAAKMLLYISASASGDDVQFAACYFTDLYIWSRSIGENEGQGAVATGADTAAVANHSYAGGLRTFVKGINAFGHGRDLVIAGEGAFGAGVGGEALEYGAFTCGDQNKSRMYNAFTCGAYNEADNSNVLVGGTHNLSGIGNQAVFGKYNAKRTDAMLVVGNGTSTTRNNALVVKTDGNVLADGAFTPNGADYAEFFEWTDGNPDAEDRIGLVVALEGEKIRPAMPGDDVLGIVSGTAAVLGDSAAMHWKYKYLTDEYGRVLYDMVEEFMDAIDGNTGEAIKVSLGVSPQPRLNPDFNPDSTYIPREERKEWDQIGLMGKLFVRDDGALNVGDYGCPGENGILTKSDIPTNIRVMKRTSDNIVLVLLK